MLLLSYILCNYLYNYVIKQIFAESYSHCMYDSFCLFLPRSPIGHTLGFLFYYAFFVLLEYMYSDYYVRLSLLFTYEIANHIHIQSIHPCGGHSY